MKDLPYLCKRDLFCVFRNALIGFVVWLLAMNFIAWIFGSKVSFVTPYSAYNPYGVFIQKYCCGDSVGKELAFQKYVGSRVYFDDMRDYGIELEEIPVLFYDIQCLREGVACNTKAYISDNPKWVINEGLPPTSKDYLVFRDTKRLCEIANINYEEWADNMERSARAYQNADKDEPDERLLVYMPYYHTTLGRNLLDSSLLKSSLATQKGTLSQDFCWWDIVSPRNARYEVNYEWLLSLFEK